MAVGSTEDEEHLLSMVLLKKLTKDSSARCLAEESMRLFPHHFLLRDSPRDLVASSGEDFKRFEIGMAHSSLGSSNVRARSPFIDYC